VADQPAAGRERRLDAGLGRIPRHPHDAVDRPLAVGAWLVHLLEPERCQAIVRVDEVLIGAVRPRGVAEHGPPERHDRGSVRRAGNDREALDRGRIGGQPQLGSGFRDRARELDIGLHDAVFLALEGADEDHDAVVTDVDLRTAAVANQPGDCANELGGTGEGIGAEERVGALGQHPPRLDALGRVELRRIDPVVHRSP
jgi:hypothetical protein